MNAKTLIPLAVIAVCLYVKAGGQIPSLPSWPTPATPVVVPSSEMQGLVGPVRTKLAANKTKAAQVRNAYAAFADVIERDAGEVVKSTAVFSEGHKRTLDLIDAEGEPKVGAEIDAAILSALGLAKTATGGYPNVPLDAPKRARLVEVLKAVSWAGT